MENQPNSEDIEKRLLGYVLLNGCASLTRASLCTGHGCRSLSIARDSLLEKKLIRVVPNQGERLPELISYELNIPHLYEVIKDSARKLFDRLRSLVPYRRN